ncbi:glycosyltransferase family 2 protein [Haloferula sp.]|uniref:glycosyltransferase family 2 protein n=1 Tax=Haloferula sp. TaxID=2497595 RepID=UPI00329B98E5
MKTSIVIVNWNSKDYLRECLKSLSDQCSSLNLEIIVVDGGSFDGCDEMLASEFPEVVFVQSKENIGFARSNNLGFQSVTGERLVLLNPDTVVRGDAIKLLLEELDRLPEAGLLGARLLNTDGSLQKSSVMAFPTPLNQALGSEFLYKFLPGSSMWKSGEAYAATEPVEVDAVSGACMVIRSELFARVGGFSTAYFMYAEDIDLCKRVEREGLKVYHVPQAEIVHHGGGSSETRFNRFSDVMKREALHHYMILNHGRFSAFAYRVAMGIAGVGRIALLAGSWLISGGEKKAARMESIKKWGVVLRWSLGLESWARKMNSKAPEPLPGQLSQVDI